jgi:hypothetical protein
MNRMAHVKADAKQGIRVEGRKPPGWEDDSLGSFLAMASDNVLGTDCTVCVR